MGNGNVKIPRISLEGLSIYLKRDQSDRRNMWVGGIPTRAIEVDVALEARLKKLTNQGK
jgi:hypothetical protein